MSSLRRIRGTKTRAFKAKRALIPSIVFALISEIGSGARLFSCVYNRKRERY